MYFCQRVNSFQDTVVYVQWRYRLKSYYELPLIKIKIAKASLNFQHLQLD